MSEIAYREQLRALRASAAAPATPPEEPRPAPQVEVEAEPEPVAAEAPVDLVGGPEDDAEDDAQE
jgi:hypothetical protein